MIKFLKILFKDRKITNLKRATLIANKNIWIIKIRKNRRPFRNWIIII